MSAKKSYLRRIVLDVLKPHEPSLDVISTELVGQFDEIDAVNITVYEIDQKTQNVKLTIQGMNLDFSKIKVALEGFNCAIHSIDQVIAGKYIIENIETPQD
jgi:hypothetical protein